LTVQQIQQVALLTGDMHGKVTITLLLLLSAADPNRLASDCNSTINQSLHC
jgi:hypothetical protein